MATNPPNMGAHPPQAGGVQPPHGMTPEQMKQMQLVVKQCMQMLLQDQTADMIVAKAKEGQPAQVIADLVGPLLSKVSESAAASGVEVGMVTMMVAGVQVMGILAEMLFQADVIPSEQQLPQLVAEASKIAVQQHNANAQQMQGQGKQPAPAGAAPPPAGGGMMMQGGV